MYIRILLQFNVLVKLHGVSGDVEGTKIIQSIVDAFISPELLSQYTWTGKTNKKNVKKLKFKSLVNVLRIVKRVLLAADNSYNETKFKKDMTEKIMKYAQYC